MRKAFALSFFLSLFLLFFPCVVLSAAEQITVVFTHDIHSHFDEYSAGQGVRGGIGRMKTVIDDIKKENSSCVVVDAGDFSMGTLYQTLFRTEASEMVMLALLGYDATTIGNHEFDFRQDGLTDMLNAASAAKRNYPEISFPALLNCNINWDNNTDEDDVKLKAAMDEYGSYPYTVIERNGVRIGIFGLLGEEAEEYTPLSGLVFQNAIESSKAVVEQLKQLNVDLIIALSHSGTFEDKDKSEDEHLARAVPEIDVIVSGHTHTTMYEPIQIGSTYIVSAGCYAEFIGQLDLEREENGRWKMNRYRLHSIDGSVKSDDYFQDILLNYKSKINQDYLLKYDYIYDQILCINNIDFEKQAANPPATGESGLGNLIADSYFYAVKTNDPTYQNEPMIAITAVGVIRGTFPIGPVSVNDAFMVSSLGSGKDGTSGYPLVKFYLTGRELYDIAEIDVSVSHLMYEAQLFASGLKWCYNTKRMFLNRVFDVKYVDETGEEHPIIDDRQYCVITNLYCAQMLGSVKDKSFGLLTINPKDKDGKVITNFDEHIVYDEKSDELKEWSAVAGYLTSMKVIDTRYEQPEGRKVESKRFLPSELLCNFGKITWILTCISGVLLITVVLVVVKVIRSRKNRINRGNSAKIQNTDSRR